MKPSNRLGKVNSSYWPEEVVLAPCLGLLFFPLMCTLSLFSVKSMIQKEAFFPKPQYQSPFKAFLSIYRRDGFSRFYQGIAPQMIRSFGVHGINFMVYEYVLAKCKSYS